ncbi:capsule biosynthesis protein [Avibacterium sp. 20-15]|uniref:capsule biosynthesis protein n=1 Tax=unclassified Avibacterium TaxID=2685287 RepID=UPI00202700C1|nr:MULTISPECIES: capsule biosynthesis protein [unclassified Avibacterium]MCW9732354.1 capsule biosynthesis protein [Avibacterium sp. 20-15]URL04520.1 capsule biosynthesis protein [Avibacterium sp. 20-132]
MVVNNLNELVVSSKRILLLQGPVGHFFKEFADWLSEIQQKTVYKLNFNAGDKFFFSTALKNQFIFDYNNTLEHFDAFLLQFCKEHNIDTIVCFGDNRRYHRIAKAVTKKLGCAFWVFEEGYFRPHYVTLEKEGVNAYSSLPRDKQFFLQQVKDLSQNPQPIPVANGFFPMAKLATKYYVVARNKANYFPHYKHHRIYNLNYYIKLWLISGIKHIYYATKEKFFIRKIDQNKLGDFYILPLQVYDDSQVKVHCDFESVEQFLIYVLDSFVKYAPHSLTLIVKHHPMDRGFISYKHIITRYLSKYPELKERLFYVYDIPMPVLLRHGKGMVTLNSTSGLSALIHNMPVLTLGRAHYDIPDITHQGSLEEFWHNPQKPDAEAFQAYHLYHLHKTQLNGSFYNKVILPEEKIGG